MDNVKCVCLMNPGLIASLFLLFCCSSSNILGGQPLFWAYSNLDLGHRVSVLCSQSWALYSDQTHLLVQIFFISFSFILEGAWWYDTIMPGILIEFGTYRWIRHTSGAAQSDWANWLDLGLDRSWKWCKVKYDWILIMERLKRFSHSMYTAHSI